MNMGAEGNSRETDINMYVKLDQDSSQQWMEVTTTALLGLLPYSC